MSKLERLGGPAMTVVWSQDTAPEGRKVPVVVVAERDLIALEDEAQRLRAKVETAEADIAALCTRLDSQELRYRTMTTQLMRAENDRDALRAVGTEPYLCYHHRGPGKSKPACPGCLTEERIAHAHLMARFDFVGWLREKDEWSAETFGPGERTAALVEHMRRELVEVLADPADIVEWVDIVFLATEGAARMGHTPEAFCEALKAKLAKNKARTWPDWRTVPAGQPIEHVRTDE
jgi:hypothetical protein